LTSVQQKSTWQFLQHSFALAAEQMSALQHFAMQVVRCVNREKNCDLIGRLKPCVIALLDSLPAHCHSRIAINTRLAGASVVIYVMRRVDAGVCFQSATTGAPCPLGIQNSSADVRACQRSTETTRPSA
jgi:hypothetical protein